VPVLQPTAPTDVIALFEQTFGRKPKVVASAPGRVNLIGEHTDYNGGQVLPIAIAHRTHVAVHLSPNSNRSRATSANASSFAEWNPTSPRRTADWGDYVMGVTQALAERKWPAPAIEVAVVSDVPAGAGLSSSAALEVATAIAAAALVDFELSPDDAARVSHRAETEYVGVACGIMDQSASSLAHHRRALHLYCDTGRIEHVPMNEAVLIFDTAVPRALRASAYNTRRAECSQALERLRRSNPGLASLANASVENVRAAKLPWALEKRALHVIEETARVEETVAALHDTGAIRGDLLFESHESLAAFYECSSPELDWFVDRASHAPGVRGARLTGAGWGGCAIAVGDIDALREFAASSTRDYTPQFGISPRTWITYAESGARVESVSD
jgi:galactokinase